MKPTPALYDVWFRRDTTLNMNGSQILVVAGRAEALITLRINLKDFIIVVEMRGWCSG